MTRPAERSRWCPRCQGAKAPTAEICPACAIVQDAGPAEEITTIE